MSKRPPNSDLKFVLLPKSGIIASLKVVEMLKRGGSSAHDSSTEIQEIGPRIEAVTTLIFSLTSTNYRLWAMRMEVYLEAHGLWEVITGTKTNRKKD